MFKVSFTPEMGARIEALASKRDLYATSYIREVMEVHVIDKEKRSLAADVDRKATLKERLNEELGALNEDMMRIQGKRESVLQKIRCADDGGDALDEIDDRDLEFSEEEDEGFDDLDEEEPDPENQ